MPIGDPTARLASISGAWRSLLLAFALCLSPALGAAQPAGLLANQAAGEYDCVIKPSDEVHVSTPIAGVLKSVDVERGDIVKRGEIVAQLNSDVERAELAIAQRKSMSVAKIDSAAARVAYLKRKLERSRTLGRSQFVSAGTLDEDETNLAVAEQDLQSAESDHEIARLEADRAAALLEQRTIRSPISGVVTERKLSAGEYWNEQQWVVTIASVHVLNVEAFVPLALHGTLHVGDRATVKPETAIGGEYTATIDIVDRVYDAASGTFGVRLKLPNADLAIPAGIRCRIRFRRSGAEHPHAQ